MRHVKDLKSLKNQISITRAKMNELWNQRGCTDAEVLAVSVQLDRLLNQYQQIIYSKK
jgi:hypothetical protein